MPAAESRRGTTDPATVEFLGQRFADSELVIGLVGAVGTDLSAVFDILKQRLGVHGYDVHEVKVSRDIIAQIVDPTPDEDRSREFDRINGLMNDGNEARKQSEENSVLALGVAAWISAKRDADTGGPKHAPRRAYIVNSLKHPDEVARLREIYPQGFYLIGVHQDSIRREEYLKTEKRMSADDAKRLMDRDEDERVPHGQRTRDTFHMSDFFVLLDENRDRLKHSLWRILNVLFGHPNVSPTFDEYAMFMAFSASLRSADLSRQVGAVVTRDQQIIATGANDCPQFGGGQYWPTECDSEIKDRDRGRDYTRGEDANQIETQRIIDDILRIAGQRGIDTEQLRGALETSRLGDLTEFGRVVHAEMEALLSCARMQINTCGASLFCTTFPCHNCAKHIVAAGIHRVVYVEPYPKSKAAELHDDSISLGFSNSDSTLHFEPFVGVGPRRFFDLFSMRLGSGYPLSRKDKHGKALAWKPEDAKLRIQMLPSSYLELELLASKLFNSIRETKEAPNGQENDRNE